VLGTGQLLHPRSRLTVPTSGHAGPSHCRRAANHQLPGPEACDAIFTCEIRRADGIAESTPRCPGSSLVPVPEFYDTLGMGLVCLLALPQLLGERIRTIG
jgi:hypothetical protein